MIKKVVFRGILLILGLLIITTAVGLVWRASRQSEVSKAMAIRDANGIDERRHIRIGGVEQWITIRGRNRDNPAVLVLNAWRPWCTGSAFHSLYSLGAGTVGSFSCAVLSTLHKQGTLS